MSSARSRPRASGSSTMSCRTRHARATCTSPATSRLPGSRIRTATSSASSTTETSSHDHGRARHDAQAFLAPEIRGALADLVQCEGELAARLKRYLEEDQAMLVAAKESS